MFFGFFIPLSFSKYNSFAVSSILHDDWDITYSEMGADGNIFRRTNYSCLMTPDKEKTKINIKVYEGSMPHIQKTQNDTRPIFDEYDFNLQTIQSGFFISKKTKEEITYLNFTDTTSSFLGAFGVLSDSGYQYYMNLINHAIIHCYIYSLKTGEFNELMITRAKHGNDEPWYYTYSKPIGILFFFALFYGFLTISPKLVKIFGTDQVTETHEKLLNGENSKEKELLKSKTSRGKKNHKKTKKD